MTEQNDEAPREAILLTTNVAPPARDRIGYQPLTATQLERLHTDLHPSRVSKRDQGGRSLSYLEAYDVKATLIRIFGYGNFSVEVLDVNVIHTSTYKAPNNPERELWRIAATATVKLTIHQTGAVYMESAASSQSGPDIGEVMDFAIKTAESDALKRCAIYLGSTFGLSLYNDGQTQDVVRFVFSPDQKPIIDELRAAKDKDRGQDRAALQSSMKTHNTPEEVAAAVAEIAATPAAEAPESSAPATTSTAASRRRTQPVGAAS